MKRTVTPVIAVGAMLVAFAWSVAVGLPQLRETPPEHSAVQTSSVQQ